MSRPGSETPAEAPPGPLTSATAALLVIGNEILSGKVVDENTPWLCKQLRTLGVDLRRIEVVADDCDAIAEATARLAGGHTYLFTSGGIGPTHDDVTVVSVAQGLGLDVVSDVLLDQLLRQHYGSQVTEAHLRMARVPRGAEVLTGPDLPIPVVKIRNVMLLPGIPALFRRLFRGLAPGLEGEPFYTRKVFVDLPEPALVDSLETVTSQHPKVLVGSYPQLEGTPGPRVTLTFDSRSAPAADAAASHLVGLLEPSYVVGVE